VFLHTVAATFGAAKVFAVAKSSVAPSNTAVGIINVPNVALAGSFAKSVEEMLVSKRIPLGDFTRIDAAFLIWKDGMETSPTTASVAVPVTVSGMTKPSAIAGVHTPSPNPKQSVAAPLKSPIVHFLAIDITSIRTTAVRITEPIFAPDPYVIVAVRRRYNIVAIP
jgi:hypothetical protein